MMSLEICVMQFIGDKSSTWYLLTDKKTARNGPVIPCYDNIHINGSFGKSSESVQCAIQLLPIKLKERQSASTGFREQKICC